ncbi:MAG: LLM class flavin-dependent oxidoreductase [Alphaproteobacteria bacterium]|jgi:alkanesulfonate monooxygenase SsuD/methylene tetrahydromethanopterin reductase-like flavin-dependent oxidoreductase (luciferase family)|nr:LLM class flavin-dependent oxidoreductase [Alphaproteobacteria bacterium]
MDVGYFMIFSSYGWDNQPDGETWKEELRLADVAADLGFDCLWSTEHHFADYSFIPDNIQLMTHLAAKHTHIDVGTAAVILPWHDPLRVAEQIVMLDILSEGRLRFGMGRGLARREFEGFRLSMDESRGRFDEASSMIINALETGFIEGDGPIYKQPRTEIRPRPQRSMAGRLYSVATSEESVESVAKLGDVRMVMFADRPWEMRAPVINYGRELHLKHHGRPAPPPMLTDFAICADNNEKAEEMARKYQGKFTESNFYHYEFLGQHFANVKGYDGYQEKAEFARQAGGDLKPAVENFMKSASWGTPNRILRELEKRREVVGDFELNVSFRFGGTPYEVSEASLKLFAKEVLPVLKTWKAEDAVAAE